MLRELLPRYIEVEERGDDLGGVQLFSEELHVLKSAGAKRRSEFSTLRGCARLAMRRLGYVEAPIIPGPRGAPMWPSGLVGSMTHCAGYRACALARASDVYAIGIDSEPNSPLPEGVLGEVTVQEERALLRALDIEHPSISWDRMLFSVKESLYKAWYPATGCWLDFDEARVSIDASGGTFRGTINSRAPVDGPRAELREISGRWAVERDLIVTAAWVKGTDG